MSSDQAVFESAVDALYVRGLKGRVTEALKDKMRAAGIDLDKKLQPAYPRSAWEACLHATAAELFPKLGKDEALFQLGRTLVEGATQNLIGQAVIAMAKVVGPARSLARMTRNFRAANNYMETTLTQVGPTAYELWVNETSNAPTYVAGTLDYALRAIGLAQLRIEVKKREGRSATFLVQWQ